MNLETNVRDYQKILEQQILKLKLSFFYTSCNTW